MVGVGGESLESIRQSRCSLGSAEKEEQGSYLPASGCKKGVPGRPQPSGVLGCTIHIGITVKPPFLL